MLLQGAVEVEYLIKWQGYPHSDNSWVRVSDMNCWTLLQNYLSRNVFNGSKAPAVAKEKTKHKAQPADERVSPAMPKATVTGEENMKPKPAKSKLAVAAVQKMKSRPAKPKPVVTGEEETKSAEGIRPTNGATEKKRAKPEVMETKIKPKSEVAREREAKAEVKSVRRHLPPPRKETEQNSGKADQLEEKHKHVLRAERRSVSLSTVSSTTSSSGNADHTDEPHYPVLDARLKVQNVDEFHRDSPVEHVTPDCSFSWPSRDIPPPSSPSLSVISISSSEPILKDANSPRDLPCCHCCFSDSAGPGVISPLQSTVVSPLVGNKTPVVSPMARSFLLSRSVLTPQSLTSEDASIRDVSSGYGINDSFALNLDSSDDTCSMASSTTWSVGSLLDRKSPSRSPSPSLVAIDNPPDESNTFFSHDKSQHRGNQSPAQPSQLEHMGRRHLRSRLHLSSERPHSIGDKPRPLVERPHPPNDRPCSPDHQSSTVGFNPLRRNGFSTPPPVKPVKPVHSASSKTSVVYMSLPQLRSREGVDCQSRPTNGIYPDLSDVPSVAWQHGSNKPGADRSVHRRASAKQHISCRERPYLNGSALPSPVHHLEHRQENNEEWSRARLRKRNRSYAPFSGRTTRQKNSIRHLPDVSDIQAVSPTRGSLSSSLSPTPSPPVPLVNQSSTQYKGLLLGWQHQLNILRNDKEAVITVENDIDKVTPPFDYKYITENCYGEGVPNPTTTETLCGCSCFALGKKCGPRSGQCCPNLAQSQFAYTMSGRVRVDPGIPIYECNSRCSCPPDCANRVVQHGRKIPLCIFRTPNGRGWGVKTTVPIKVNMFVSEYVGEVITSSEAEKRDKEYQKEGLFYLFDLDFNDLENPAFIIDGTRTGNISHFFNHSVSRGTRAECSEHRAPVPWVVYVLVPWL